MEKETATEFHFAVKLKLKQGNKITREQARTYVREAVQSWKGCYPPDSNEFDLDANQFTVNHMYPARTR